jgi:hypothetical protein
MQRKKHNSQLDFVPNMSGGEGTSVKLFCDILCVLSVCDSILVSGSSSLLLCGLGSKVALLNDFCIQTISPSFPCIVLKGYTSTSSTTELCKELLSNLAHCFGIALPASGTANEKWRGMAAQLSERRTLTQNKPSVTNANVLRHAAFGDESLPLPSELRPKYGDAIMDDNVASQPTRRMTRCCVAVHNIDGLVLRSSETQQLLSDIANAPEVMFVASIDDVNAANLWSR